MTRPSYDVACITAPVTAAKLEAVKKAFKTVHFHPHNDVPSDLIPEVDVWYTTWTGLPKEVTSLSQIPRTKIVQLSSAGANDWLARDVMQSDEAKQQIAVCSSSGVHTLSIPQYIIANIINLYTRLHLQIELHRTRAKWAPTAEVLKHAGPSGEAQPSFRTLFGKTVGMLGYGHIARETARLFKAFHCRIIAANSNGERRAESGYAIEGTGDPDCSIPEEMFSTGDAESLRDFVSKCDILVASMPSTPKTRWMLDRELLGTLRPGAVLVNIGRGDLVKSEEILAALDAPEGLWGAVLDVTDPEPLPDGHPLFTHPAVIVTTHTSGSFENYYDSGADVLIRQAERLAQGQPPINVIDPAKGY